jgi:hypothetical protein
MRFQSGNKFSKGRPKGSGFVLRCRDWADRKGWDKLEKWAAGNSKLAFEATKLLLAYGYGKPVAEIDLSQVIESTQRKEMSHEDAEELIRRIPSSRIATNLLK